MPLKAKYEHEILEWQKGLESLQQENVLLKNMATDIIKENIDHTILEKIESFLSLFINKDAVLALLRYDVAKQLKSVKNIASSENAKPLIRQQTRLGQDVAKMQREFTRLKEDFERYAHELAAAS